MSVQVLPVVASVPERVDCCAVVCRVCVCGRILLLYFGLSNNCFCLPLGLQQGSGVS